MSELISFCLQSLQTIYFLSLSDRFGFFKVTEVPKKPVPERKLPAIVAEKKEKKEVTVQKGMTFPEN